MSLRDIRAIVASASVENLSLAELQLLAVEEQAHLKRQARARGENPAGLM